MATIIVEEAHDILEAPIIRVANPDAIIPYKTENEVHILPQERDIERAIRKTIS